MVFGFNNSGRQGGYKSIPNQSGGGYGDSTRRPSGFGNQGGDGEYSCRSPGYGPQTGNRIVNSSDQGYGGVQYSSNQDYMSGAQYDSGQGDGLSNNYHSSEGQYDNGPYHHNLLGNDGYGRHPADDTFGSKHGSYGRNNSDAFESGQRDGFDDDDCDDHKGTSPHVDRSDGRGLGDRLMDKVTNALSSGGGYGRF
ncbi:hypothetical protein IWQ60_009577 [Tieghemiomyces parasiticus]|uniref:Uncharacterized protein n=1 Tax=Tieghemiomyces parasiticus TaxID=78921 RepID=A0A9W7ZX80_9FUNG|nr:hypothetical protein IWQ60_009577 [Tieghemiomyces parasiticus]